MILILINFRRDLDHMEIKENFLKGMIMATVDSDNQQI